MKQLTRTAQIMLVTAITWLLSFGCERHGLPSPDHHPATPNPATASADHKASLPSTERLTDTGQVNENPEEGLMSNAKIEHVKRVHEAELFVIDGVEGVGIGEDEDGNEFIRVYVRDKETVAKVPKLLEGFPVKTYVSGEFDAY